MCFMHLRHERSTADHLEPAREPDGVATTLGITRAQLRNAIHSIKEDAELEPRDNVTIWSDGSVTDANDELIGNIYDEI